MICWPDLNHINAFVKIATDAWMQKINSCKNVLKHFSECGITHKRPFHRRVFTEQDKRSTVKKPTRLKSLRANQCSFKSFFSSFSTKRKLIDHSFELSGFHLCLKTVHSALDWEATQQKSPQYPFSFPGKQELPYDKLTIFTMSRKKHRQQLVLVFR